MRPEEAERKYILLLRSFNGSKRVKIGAELYEMARHIIESSIRNENPNISEKELNDRVKERIYQRLKKRL